MPITALDLRTALVVIDLQRGVEHAPAIDPIPAVAEQTRALIDAFHRGGLPVVLVTADGDAPGRTDHGATPSEYPEGFADLLPQLDPHPDDHRIVKQRWGAFHQTGLAEHLHDLGVTQIVLTGFATSIGVESTARAAWDQGFHVAVVADAVTDVDADAQHNSLTRIFPRMAEVGTTAEILRLLLPGQPAL